MVSRSLKLNVIIVILGRGMELRDIAGALTLDYKTVNNGFKDLAKQVILKFSIFLKKFFKRKIK